MQYLWRQYRIALCDLKEDNIILSLTEMGAGYNVKVADFGAAYRQGEDNKDTNRFYGSQYTPLYFNQKYCEEKNSNQNLACTDSKLI